MSFEINVLIKKKFWSIAEERAGTVITDIALGTMVDRFNLFAIFPFKIRNIVFIVPSFMVDDFLGASQS